MRRGADGKNVHTPVTHLEDLEDGETYMGTGAEPINMEKCELTPAQERCALCLRLTPARAGRRPAGAGVREGRRRIQAEMRRGERNGGGGGEVCVLRERMFCRSEGKRVYPRGAMGH